MVRSVVHRIPALLLAIALAGCREAPRESASAGPTQAGSPRGRVLAELGGPERRAMCERIVAVRRAACDPALRSIDAMLVDRCATDHPVWSCATVEAAAWERCRTDDDATACATAKQQSEACGLQDTLRRRCPLFIKEVAPDGAAARAGVRGGDHVRAIDGAPVSHVDLDTVMKTITAAPGPLSFTVESAGERRELTVTPQGEGGDRRIGVVFAPPPECASFLQADGALPCSSVASSPARQ